jgi:O-acetylhomoserine (thiol)-lyase
MSQEYKFETLCLHAGQEPDPTTTARGVALHRTSSYVFKDTEHAANLFALKELGNIYTRLMNPTHDVLEQRVAALEGGAAALALSSGTSAIHYSIINICSAGDEIVSASNLYGGTFTMFDNILPQFGIQTKFADALDPQSFELPLRIEPGLFSLKPSATPFSSLPTSAPSPKLLMLTIFR